MIYLDHAATSFPKAPEVLAAMARWFTEVGVSAARGSGDRCRLAANEVAATRAALGELVGMRPEHVAFVSGATEGLNLVLRAVLPPGARVLTTAFEHSSVVRPLRALQAERGLAIEVLPPDGGAVSADAVAAALRAGRHDVLVFTHASNVTGACCDAAAFCALARAHGATSVLDASQTAGLVELQVGADVVVASGHKGLGGPPGIGFVASALPLPPQKQGGTGHSLALDEHPREWPAAFEAGTPNTPAIYGLGAALRLRPGEVRRRDLAQALDRLDTLRAELARLPAITVFHAATTQRVPVASFVHAHHDPAEVGALLAALDVQVRTGHHCAPWLHPHLGTAAAGTVRVSTSAATRREDLAPVLALLASL